RIIRFDRRGFGLSSGNASLGADVQDALSLCDELRIGRLACVGMSQGARVALHLCRIAPERLSCVVLDGPPRMLGQDAAQEVEDVPLAEYRSLFVRGEVETFRRRWSSHPLMQLETRSLQHRALLERMIARYGGNDLLQDLPAPQDHWDRAAIASLTTPALIITGEHDLPSRLRAADALSEALPGAQRASISAARHLPNLDNPPSYDSVLRAFLERHAGPNP
ncbi:MAG: alpha/beta hydrolase, partial [Gammaproteobacteria bacterium]|nr:alpha/beta hydrolase [Gammaproteobacteria bacterium]